MSAYRLWVGDTAKREGRELPGNMRRRIHRLISDLADNPRPPASRPPYDYGDLAALLEDR